MTDEFDEPMPEPEGRPSLDTTLLNAARVFAHRSTCQRLRVGAVLAVDSRIVSTGYNGVASGLPHCQHSDDDGQCLKAVHAEANVIAFAARNGISTEGSTLYVTHSPCLDCAKLLINAGVERVVYAEQYRSAAGLVLLERVGVPVWPTSPPWPVDTAEIRRVLGR